MRTDFNGKSILITGGTGSIGSELLRQILSMDVERVIVFSRDEIKHFLLKKRIQDSRLKTIIGDVRDYKSLEGVFDEFDLDIIYHAAAMKHVVICEDNPVECIKTNILGTINLTDLARKHKISKMITISTDKSANPINIMGASKFIAERITLDANFSCVRFGNVANSRGSVIPVFLNSLICKSAFEITDPAATRFIMEIPEAVELILNATHNCQGGDIFILKMRSFNLSIELHLVLEFLEKRLTLR
jgi:UDP-N-acetylglucosamine 4,6-dehydratase